MMPPRALVEVAGALALEPPPRSAIEPSTNDEISDCAASALAAGVAPEELDVWLASALMRL